MAAERGAVPFTGPFRRRESTKKAWIGLSSEKRSHALFPLHVMLNTDGPRKVPDKPFGHNDLIWENNFAPELEIRNSAKSVNLSGSSLAEWVFAQGLAAMQNTPGDVGSVTCCGLSCKKLGPKTLSNRY